MKKPILFLFLCLPFIILSQQWQISNDMKKQDNAKEVQQTSHSCYLKIGI